MYKNGQVVYWISSQGKILEFTYGISPYTDYEYEKKGNIFTTKEEAEQSERYKMLQMIYNSDYIPEEIINEVADSIEEIDCCYNCLFARENQHNFWCALQGEERSYIDPSNVCNKYIRV